MRRLAQLSGSPQDLPRHSAEASGVRRIVLATGISGPGCGLNWVRKGDPAFNRKNIHAAIEGCEAALSEDATERGRGPAFRYCNPAP
jgi:hypothetical protein